MPPPEILPFFSGGQRARTSGVLPCLNQGRYRRGSREREVEMGHHYVPRKYLRGFCEPGNDKMLWQFDKDRDAFNRVSLVSAANERDFYPPDVEKNLADHIESPANAVIDKLRCGQAINDDEATALAVYVATMLNASPATAHMRKAWHHRPLPMYLAKPGRRSSRPWQPASSPTRSRPHASPNSTVWKSSSARNCPSGWSNSCTSPGRATNSSSSSA